MVPPSRPAARIAGPAGGLAVAALAGLAGATGLAAFAGAWWLADLANVFRPHMLTASVALALAGLCLRRWPIAIAAAVLAVPHALALDSLATAPGAAAHARSDAAVVRIATVNVQRSNRDHRRLVELVRADPPDLLILMEAVPRWRPALADLAEIYPYGVPETWADGHWLLIASRLPVLAARVERHGATGWPWAVVRLDGPTGPFTVIALHPPPPIGERRAQARRGYLMAVAGAAAALPPPLIAAGDFNATPWSADYRDFARRAGVRDAARGRGWMPTWPARLGWIGIPIDRITVTPDIAVRALSVGPPIGSDHLPVIADLAMPGEPPAATLEPGNAE